MVINKLLTCLLVTPLHVMCVCVQIPAFISGAGKKLNLWMYKVPGRSLDPDNSLKLPKQRPIVLFDAVPADCTSDVLSLCISKAHDEKKLDVQGKG